MKTRRRVTLSVATCLLAAAALNVLVAWVCALLLDPSKAHPNREPPGHVTLPSPTSPDRVRTEYAYAYARKGVRIVERRQYTRPPSTMYHDQRGWPLPSLMSTYAGSPRGGWQLTEALPTPLPDHASISTWPTMQRCLPLRPVWPAFIVDTLAFALPVAALMMTSRSNRRWRRARAGRCPTCGYPAGPSAVCTECGSDLTGIRRLDA